MYTDCHCTQYRRASNVLTKIYDDALRPVGLRITQFSLLRSLGRLGEATLTQLANEAGLDLTTMSRNVKVLVDAGWVDVRPSGDGREKRLALNDAGRGRIEAAMPYWGNAQEQAARYSEQFRAAPDRGYLIELG